MKAYILVDKDRIVNESNTREDIEYMKEDLADDLIGKSKMHLHLKIFKKILRTEIEDHDSFIFAKKDGFDFKITVFEDETQSDLHLNKNECIFGLI